MKIASSITATKMIGSDMLFSTIMMMMKIAAIEIALTVAKSTEVMSIRSFVSAASPTSNPFLS